MLKQPKKLTTFLFAILIMNLPSILLAHCDTMSGPVIGDAKKALLSGELTPVLKWIHKEYEAEVKQVFQKTLEVRSLSPVAKELADFYFFETVVRLHRSGEGAPFRGLSNEPLEPVFTEADKAVESGSIEVLLEMVTSEIQKEVHHKFKAVTEKRKTADRSVEEGREYVKTYVEFLHYVEALHGAVQQEEHSD